MRWWSYEPAGSRGCPCTCLPAGVSPFSEDPAQCAQSAWHRPFLRTVYRYGHHDEPGLPGAWPRRGHHPGRGDPHPWHGARSHGGRARCYRGGLPRGGHRPHSGPLVGYLHYPPSLGRSAHLSAGFHPRRPRARRHGIGHRQHHHAPVQGHRHRRHDHLHDG